MLFLWATLGADTFTVDLVCATDGCGFNLADVTPSSSALDLKTIPPYRWWLKGADNS